MIIDDKGARQRHVRLGGRDWIGQLKWCGLLFVFFMGSYLIFWHRLIWGYSIRFAAVASAVLSVLCVYLFPWIRRKYRWFERREATKPDPFDQPF
jgi:hypothetical protein